VKKYFLALTCAALIAGPAAAHHNWRAIYDVDADIEFEGVISAIEWKNPHVRVSFTVDAGTDNERVYTTESNSVASLDRMNVTEELLAVGTPVKVAGYGSRISDSDLYVSHLLLPGIREVVFLHNIEPRWPEAVRVSSPARLLGGVVEEDFSKRPTSIFGVWTTIYENPGSHHALGKNAAEWSENARQASASTAPAAVDSGCTPKGMPQIMDIPYPIQLIDQGELILIHAEESDSIRKVYMTAEHEDSGETDILGYSTGRWVGDTLNVVTTFDGTESDSGSEMQIHETFHLSADHNRLQYTQIIIDPERRLSPTINKKWWQYQPGAYVLPYDCEY
jgi:hypothetical protein